MSYTPINWQTGDTITAEKMNKMDNGWSVQNTQLFSETVTTVDDGEMFSGNFIYEGAIDFDTIVVTFNGTDYNCQRIDAFNSYFYGGFTEEGPDFTDYPFAIRNDGANSSIFTETEGTYTVSVTAPDVAVSSQFSSAVNASIPGLIPPFRLVIDETTLSDFNDARSQNRFCYLWDGATQYIVNKLGFPSASKTPLTVYPTPQMGNFAFDANDILRYYDV